MDIKMISTTFTTDKIDETRDFYISKLGARLAFDCGWYISLEFGSPRMMLNFMTPQNLRHIPASSEGIVYNIGVEDVDAAYGELIEDAGIAAYLPLEDHPWGDRGFGIKDPNGISLYIYTEIEPDEEYRKCIK